VEVDASTMGGVGGQGCDDADQVSLYATGLIHMLGVLLDAIGIRIDGRP
jgi:hypothetical protein